mmetsp:Transcript_12860/g.25728  ORF Transcript_12860/g.25728 Transcript_12860/m.25728 type:complete len:362 (-) Transcript_12860:221-1306(-)
MSPASDAAAAVARPVFHFPRRFRPTVDASSSPGPSALPVRHWSGHTRILPLLVVFAAMHHHAVASVAARRGCVTLPSTVPSFVAIRSRLFRSSSVLSTSASAPSPPSSATTSSLDDVDVVPSSSMVPPAFSYHLPEGLCVAVRPTPKHSLPQHYSASVHPDEYALVRPGRADAIPFLLGRSAVRHALGSVGAPTAPAVLRDAHGRPALPPGYLGSISHKRRLAVALVCADGGGGAVGIGVDVEGTRSATGAALGRRVLTPGEREGLGDLPGVSCAEEVLLRFSLKESVYKALHPLFCSFVGFQEVEVWPLPDGSANVIYNLRDGQERDISCTTAHWRRIGGIDGEEGDEEFFLTSASVRRK